MSMESFIMIDGIALWIFILLIAFFVLSALFFSLRCLAIEIKNDKLIEDNAELYKELMETREKLYKANFKKRLGETFNVQM